MINKKKEFPANVIILSCLKYKYGNRSHNHCSKSWNIIKENYGEILTFIFYGDKLQDTLFKFNSNNKELSIKTSDEYDNIPLKTWLAYYYWYNKYESRKKTLITFGDDCELIDMTLFLNTSFDKIYYGGVKINGLDFNNIWHEKKVIKYSYQKGKTSPRPKRKTKFVHEGCGVVFHEKTINILLQPYDFENESGRNKFLKFVKETCWYNDVLLSHILVEYHMYPIKIPFFGIKGDD